MHDPVEVFTKKMESRGRGKVLRVLSVEAFPEIPPLTDKVTICGIVDSQPFGINVPIENASTDLAIVTAEVMMATGPRLAKGVVHKPSGIVAFLTKTERGWAPARLSDGSQTIQPAWICGYLNQK